MRVMLFCATAFAPFAATLAEEPPAGTRRLPRIVAKEIPAGPTPPAADGSTLVYKTPWAAEASAIAAAARPAIPTDLLLRSDLGWGGELSLSPEAAAAPRMAPMPNTLRPYNRRDPAADPFVITPGLPSRSQPRNWKPLARSGDDVFYIVPLGE